MSTKNLDEEQILEFYNVFYKYYLSMKELSLKHKVKIRLPNFQEGLSENMVRLFILNYENRNCQCSKIGDLCINNNVTLKDKSEEEKQIKIEVKCFSSTGPTSFGPKESWDEIYFLDACDFFKDNFKIYKCKQSNDSNIWKNMPINKNKTYNDVCKEGKRPRLQFLLIKNYLKDEIKLVFEGNLNSMVKKSITNTINTNEKPNIFDTTNKEVKTKKNKKQTKKQNDIEV